MALPKDRSKKRAAAREAATPKIPSYLLERLSNTKRGTAEHAKAMGDIKRKAKEILHDRRSRLPENSGNPGGGGGGVTKKNPLTFNTKGARKRSAGLIKSVVSAAAAAGGH